MLFGRAQRQWHSLTYATREKKSLKTCVIIYTARVDEWRRRVHERELPSVAIGAFCCYPAFWHFLTGKPSAGISPCVGSFTNDAAMGDGGASAVDKWCANQSRQAGIQCFVARRAPLFSASSSDRVCGEDGTALSLLLSVPCYSAPDREPEYCNERVCLCACVCVFVWSRSYLRNYTSDPDQIFCACYPWPWLGPPLAA